MQWPDGRIDPGRITERSFNAQKRVPWADSPSIPDAATGDGGDFSMQVPPRYFPVSDEPPSSSPQPTRISFGKVTHSVSANSTYNTTIHTRYDKLVYFFTYWFYQTLNLALSIASSCQN